MGEMRYKNRRLHLGVACPLNTSLGRNRWLENGTKRRGQKRGVAEEGQEKEIER